MKVKSLKPNVKTLALAAAFIAAAGHSTTQAAGLAGSVQVAGKPVAGAKPSGGLEPWTPSEAR